MLEWQLVAAVSIRHQAKQQKYHVHERQPASILTFHCSLFSSYICMKNDYGTR